MKRGFASLEERGVKRVRETADNPTVGDESQYGGRGQSGGDVVVIPAPASITTGDDDRVTAEFDDSAEKHERRSRVCCSRRA